VAPRTPSQRADTQGSVSAPRPARRGSKRGRSATAAKPERTASGGPVQKTDALASASGVSRRGSSSKVPVTPCFENDIVQLPPGIEVAACGIDTVSYAWKCHDERLWALLREPYDLEGILECYDPTTGEYFPASRVARKDGLVLIHDSIGGGKVGYNPGLRMIFIEGRLAALSALSDRASGLAAPWQLETTSRLSTLALSRFLGESGLLVEKCRLRRLDLAAELRFTGGDGGARGLRFLQALSALELPRQKSDSYRINGRVETVYYRTPVRGRVKLRVYDKGVESGSHPPGERIRVEHQHRWVGAKRPDPASVAASDLGRLWQGPLRVWEGCDEVVVADLNAIARVILQRVAARELTACAAERLMGTLWLRGRGHGKEWWAADGKPYMYGRRTRELRKAGVVLDEDGMGGDPREEHLPLGKVLRALRQAWPPAAPEPRC
jgi:hypothetical protein